MDPKTIVLLVIQLSIMATVFSFGLRARSADALYLVRRPGLLARSLLAMFVIMPLFAVVLAASFPLARVVEFDLVALAIAPLPPVLPSKQGKAGGDPSYSIALMATIGLLSIAIVPLSIALLGLYAHQDFEIPFAALIVLILKTTLIPLGLGMIVHRFMPALAERIEGPVGLIGKILLVLGGLVVLATTLPIMLAQIGNGTLYAITAFVIFGFVVGHLLGGPDPHERSVLALATACRHPAIALAIVSASEPQERFVGAMLLYLIINGLIGVPYVQWRKRVVARHTASE